MGVSWLKGVHLSLARTKRILASLASRGSSKPVLRSRGIIARFSVWPQLLEHERAILWTGRQGLLGPLRSCFAGFVCPFTCLFAAVGVAVHSTPVVTTVQLAQVKAPRLHLGKCSSQSVS